MYNPITGDKIMTVGMFTLETQFPEDIFNILQARGLFKDVLAKETRRLLALRFYRERVLSLGKAARLAGLTRWEFTEFLSENDIPILDYSPEELAGEFDAVAKLEAELKR
jgi:predicted HTH domain antitoxin